MDRTKLLLLVVSGLAVASLVSWLGSSDATMSTPIAAVELQPRVTPLNRKEVKPVPSASTDAPALPRAMETANAATSAAIPKAPVRVHQPEEPAAVVVARRELAVPPPAPVVKALPVPVTSYEQRVTAAVTIAGEDSDRALRELRRISAGEPNRPEAYEAMAGISLRQRDYFQARDAIESALWRGGKATFTIIHDHSRGNFDANDAKATCVGELTIVADEVKFTGPGEGDRFSADWASVREAGFNKFFGSGIGGFHVTISAAGKYKNFNLAPGSKDKAEGKLILDLLASYIDGRDRTR